MAKRNVSPHTHFYGLGADATLEQRAFRDAILDDSVQLVIANAKAGTGKTTWAVAGARYRFDTKDIRCTYVFSPVEEASMGHRPGTQSEKEREYLTPLYDALVEIGDDPRRAIVDRENVEAIKNGSAWIDAMTHTFVRGSNVKNRTLIVEEAQNWRVHELKKMLTRIHDTTKVIVIGHTGQIDLADSETSGFARLIEHFRDEPYVRICELTKNFRGRLASKADEM
jgi:predicted ribonuclease YlaK